MPIAIVSAQTDIEIISQACKLLGNGNFNTIEPGNKFAQDAAAFYGTLVTAELGSNRWTFAMKTEAMGVLNLLDPDFSIWRFFWEFPADMIMFHRVDPWVRYTIQGDRFLTTSNSPNLVAVYSHIVPVSKWPNGFKMYIIYALADMLAVSVTNSDRMVARITSGLQMWQSRALFADGQAKPPRTMRSRPYIDVRE